MWIYTKLEKMEESEENEVKKGRSEECGEVQRLSTVWLVLSH